MVTRNRKLSEANAALVARIREIKAEHPVWGYRQVWAYIRFRDETPVNIKRVHRLMKDNTLMVKKSDKLKATRASVTRKPRTYHPNQIWGIDMTKIMIQNWGWVYLHIALDWGSKKIVGYNLSLQSKAEEWLSALDMALCQQFPNGVRDVIPRLALVSDHGSQPTSKAFSIACQNLNINQIFASYGNPKGNADTERVIRTIKEDLIWPKEWENIKQLEAALAEWINNYNTDYPHSTLGYMTPYEYEKHFENSPYAA